MNKKNATPSCFDRIGGSGASAAHAATCPYTMTSVPRHFSQSINGWYEESSAIGSYVTGSARGGGTGCISRPNRAGVPASTTRRGTGAGARGNTCGHKPNAPSAPVVRRSSSQQVSAAGATKTSANRLARTLAARANRFCGRGMRLDQDSLVVIDAASILRTRLKRDEWMGAALKCTFAGIL